jgi:hypothetical protein
MRLVLLGICGELTNRVREFAFKTVQATVQVHGHTMRRAVPHYAYVLSFVSSGDGPKSSLIMPGSRVRVPPLLSMSQSLDCGWLMSFPGVVQDAADSWSWLSQMRSHASRSCWLGMKRPQILSTSTHSRRRAVARHSMSS